MAAPERLAGSAALIYGVDMVVPGPPMEAIHAELDRAHSEFHNLITHATAADLRRKSAGTDWSTRRLEEVAAWIRRYQELWDARFRALDDIVEDLKRQEKNDERK